MSLMAAVADSIEPDAKALIGDGADDALVAAASIAISLKRLADAIHRDVGEGLPTFLDQLHGVLSDASHDHAQRMK